MLIPYRGRKNVKCYPTMTKGQGWGPSRLSDGRVDFLASLVRVGLDLQQILHQEGVLWG